MKKIFIILFILINGAVYLLYMYPHFFMKDFIRIAVVGPMESPKGRAMRKGIELYKDQVNKQGGIDGMKLKLLFFDDKNNQKTAEKIALEIAEANNVLLVLGHYYSSTSTAAGKIYKRNGIPAITASATAESVIAGNEWYFRVVPDNVLEARFVANYINKGMKKRVAAIVFTKDDYGISLAENFEKAVKSLGMKMTGKWEWDADKSPDEQLKMIKEGLKTIEDPGILFFATHSTEGVKIITALKDAGHSFPMIVSDAFAGVFFKELKPYPLEWSNPGYYSDGIYFVSPFMLDIGGADAFRFGNAFYRKHQEYPEEVSACYYDAVHVAVEAVKKSGIQGKKQIREDRRNLRDSLAGFYNERNSVRGVTGLIWFDENGGVKRHFAVGVWQEQKALPAFSQYRRNSAHVDNVVQAVLDGGIILTDDIVMSHTQVVYVGTEIIQVSDIDVERSEFTAEFHLWFRYPGYFDDTSIEFENAVTPVVLGNPVKETIDGDISTRTYRIKSRFQADFDFRSFPFDGQQKLPIHFRHKYQTNDKLIYVPEILVKDLGYTVSGWNISKVQFYQDAVLRNAGLSYSRFNAEIGIKKNASAIFVFLVLLPVILMTSSLYLIFYLPPKGLWGRLLIIMIALSMNMILYLRQFVDLPVGYFTAIDYIYFAEYILIVIFTLISLFIYRFLRI